jgi:hypothetical protein
MVYAGEKERANAVTPILEKLTGDKFLKQEVSGAIPDGVVVTAMARRPLAYRAFLEFKNEIGTGGSDPVAQDVKGYEKFWAEEQVRHIGYELLYWGLNYHVDQCPSCCCPSSIVAIAAFLSLFFTRTLPARHLTEA